MKRIILVIIAFQVASLYADKQGLDAAATEYPRKNQPVAADLDTEDPEYSEYDAEATEMTANDGETPLEKSDPQLNEKNLLQIDI